ncbi:MAG: hypothetical protein PVI24_02845, partial [Myxococcales bacterium]
MVRLFTLLGIAALGACVTEPLSTGQTISMGTSDAGYLHDAAALSDRGDGYRRLRPEDATRYG